MERAAGSQWQPSALHDFLPALLWELEQRVGGLRLRPETPSGDAPAWPGSGFYAGAHPAETPDSPPLPRQGQGPGERPKSVGDAGTMSNNMAKIAEARKAVEQLKLEVNIDRMKVSKAAAELLAYCEAHAKEDPLVAPVPAAENPFREKRLFCVLL
ncbi:guanine nucleotide-binding protein G(I)/G(S)/G(O) subunit gamma-8 [Alligator mississippiensis]|uniref:Guanine nucleotide-binding protein subunit gamma n=1 Tax=Alligator mississippiensis TaxID=8496 RepID=A0A151P1V9_ALLMI|nr:guanine nucleotide-binding protein G(I)/G(S)/G(O) subunit gamma-8 [Alligator mississippiensis]